MAKKFSELVFYPNAKKKGQPEESGGTLDMKNSMPSTVKEEKNSDQMDITHRSGRKEKVKVHMTGSDYHIVKNKDGAQYTVDKKGNVLHGHGNANEEVEIEEGKAGLWANIHAKRKRIEAGSGERMRKPGSEGAPTKAALKASQNEGRDYNNNRTGFAKREREDDEYHVPDPVGQTHKIGFSVSKDGGEKHSRTVTISNSTKSKEQATASARAHLEKQGYKIHEEVELDEATPTSMQVKQGIGIARDKRYAGGNMTGAVKAMDKVNKGLAQHPAVKKELQKQNEDVDKGEYDYEGQMARTQLQTTMRNCEDLIDMIKDDENMPEWVQSKITLAQDYITTVRDYLQSKEELAESVSELNKHVSDFSKGVKSSAAKQSTYKRDGKPIHNMKHVETDSDHQKVFDHLKKMGYKKTGGYDSKPNEFTMHHNREEMTAKSDPVHHSSGVSAHVEKEHGGKTKVHFTHRNIKEQAPVAPVPDRKYIKGTPENKALKASRKPINGHPTGQAKTDDSLRAYYASKKSETKKEETMLTFTSFVEALKGNQHKIDKNKNGKVDGHDFKLLRKEETEQIDELSTDKLKAYKSAAQADRSEYHDSKSSGDKDEAEYAKKKIMKRSSGIADANKRLNKEEVELDEARVNGREYASQGVMHPDHAKMDIHKASNQEVDFYASKTGDKMQGKVLKNDGKEVHIKANKELGDGKLHKFKVTANLPKPQNEEVEIEENAFDYKSKRTDASSGRYEIKRVDGRTIVTRKYNPDTGISTGTDDNEPAEKRGRGRPAGSKNRGSAK